MRDSLCGKSLGQKKELSLICNSLLDGDEGSRIPHSGRHIREPPSMRLHLLSPELMCFFIFYPWPYKTASFRRKLGSTRSVRRAHSAAGFALVKNLCKKKTVAIVCNSLSDGDEGSRIPRSGRHILVPPYMRLRSLLPVLFCFHVFDS